MAVNVCLPLFAEPGRELENDSHILGQHLRALGDQLRDRLHRAAQMLDRLAADGWSPAPAQYEVLLTRPDVETREQAERQLRALGLDPIDFLILEEVEDEEE